MSLIVAYNGQFKPYKLAEKVQTIPGAKKVHKTNAIFKDLLKEFVTLSQDENHKGSSSDLKNPAIKIYSKMQNHKRVKYYAKDLMQEYVKVLRSEATIEDAMKLMEKEHFHHIPIVDDGKLFGMISDKNILIALANNEDRKTQLFSIMSKKVISAQQSTSISDIARVMLDEDIHALPIVDSKVNILGIITITDLLSFLTTSFPLEIYT